MAWEPGGLKWTQEEDDYLHAHYSPAAAAAIGNHLGRTRSAVMSRASIIRATRKPFRHVARAVWIAVATEEAQRAGVVVSYVLAGAKTRAYVEPRWRAWQRLHNEAYSLNQIAIVSGHDHTSVRHGILALSKASSTHRAERVGR